MIESRVEFDGSVRVKFRLPNVNGAQRICVVGEFNAWCPTANPMHVEGDDLVTEIRLQPGRTYRFRYLLDDERWENDWAADNYVPNEFGGDDSVLDLTHVASSARDGTVVDFSAQPATPPTNGATAPTSVTPTPRSA
jgi:1,4-alpha-glucan branching enzyme